MKKWYCELVAFFDITKLLAFGDGSPPEETIEDFASRCFIDQQVDAFEEYVSFSIEVEVEEVEFKAQALDITAGVLEDQDGSDSSLGICGVLEELLGAEVLPDAECLAELFFASKEDLKEDLLFELISSTAIDEDWHEVGGQKLLEREEQVGGLESKV